MSKHSKRGQRQRHAQTAKYIFLTCMLLVGVFSAFVLYRNAHPSRGVPYEEATMAQAEEYMRYEKNYILLDVSDEETFAAAHMPGAVNIPYAGLVERCAVELPDKEEAIYVCGQVSEDARKAARKLCALDYNNITLIISGDL